MIASRHTGGALVVAFVLSLVSCGAGGREALRPTPSSLSASTREARVTCGGSPGWRASAMDGGINSRFDAGELRSALEALVNETGTMAPTALQDVAIEAAPWFVLTESEHAVTIATGTWDGHGPGKDGQIVQLERAGAGWRAVGHADCMNLRPVIDPGFAWVELSVPGELDRSSTQPTVGVTEVTCTGGRDPRPFLREPRIVEDDHSVTISWTTEALTGAHHCVGRMPVPQVVHLDKPLGDRVLLDGSHWPARPIAGSR